VANESVRMRWAVYATLVGEMGIHAKFGSKPERKRPLRIPRRTWKDSIKMDLRGVGYKRVDCIHGFQCRFHKSRVIS
jgi:hypothetical protein